MMTSTAYPAMTAGRSANSTRGTARMPFTMVVTMSSAFDATPSGLATVAGASQTVEAARTVATTRRPAAAARPRRQETRGVRQRRSTPAAIVAGTARPSGLAARSTPASGSPSSRTAKQVAHSARWASASTSSPLRRRRRASSHCIGCHLPRQDSRQRAPRAQQGDFGGALRHAEQVRNAVDRLVFPVAKHQERALPMRQPVHGGLHPGPVQAIEDGALDVDRRGGLYQVGRRAALAKDVDAVVAGEAPWATPQRGPWGGS